jgi:dTDP-4-amino-4,6-dideoxygalactose transaminase
VDTNELHLIDETKIEEKITDKTKAILPVHLYGQICEMDKIMAISKKHNLKVIEDCAQAHGATYNNQKAGSFGHIACFSFFPTKNMTVAGDGGIIITNDSELAELCRQYRDGGRKKGEPDESYVVGMNMRLSEILAAVARVQLKKLEGWNEARIKLSQRYNDELKDIVQIPKTTENRRHIYHLYVIQTENRDELRAFLKENKIESGVHYSIPMHLLKVNSNLGHRAGDAPHSEKTIKEIVSIPIYPELTKKDQTKIIEKIKEFKVK